jgi:hypothetical protein
VIGWALPKLIAPFALTTVLSVVPTFAVSDAVTHACRNDYFEHCSVHAVGSEGLRRCMRANGHALSLRCVYALIKAGDVTLAEVKAIERRFKKAPIR